MTTVTNIKQFAADRAKADFAMDGQSIVAVASLERHGDQILKSVLRDLERHEQYKVIFHAWSNLELACIQLCELISRQFPGKKGPLIDEIILKAFQSFEMSSAAHESELYCVARFLNVLADSAYEIQKTNVYTLDPVGSPIPWPYFAQSLSIWAKKTGMQEIYFSPAPQPSAEAIVGGRHYLCTRILTMHDIGRLALTQITAPRTA